ncbi:hypothetical protein [Streptomyces sp. UNOC14_S4]|uniref:hypothetical protein n=1 Tax=Streptomyces sp. UNOC14_S4 TaxID=2872340 RepID=UPI001E3EB0C6|nr:hypothetical protein [Streptomyces sp. UNOC14_S4]MCC3766049.1 hypothetical protein [Streptomyces sp. UNOC14_S4]
MPPRKKISPRDHTAMVHDELVKNRELAEKEAAQRELMEAQVAEEVRSQVVDLTQPDVVVETQQVEVGDPVREMQVVEDLRDVTIGYRQTYDFEAGRKYRVPSHVYAHLHEKRLVWGA